jgi:hypothetical protein
MFHLLVVNILIIAKQLGFDQRDKYQSSKFVPYDQVNIFEKIEPFKLE